MNKNAKVILCALTSASLINPCLLTTVYASSNKASLEEIARANISTVKMEVYNITSLSVRKGASTKHSILGEVKKGKILEVISTSNGWSKIKFNGTTGYVNSKYLKKVTTSALNSTMIVQKNNLVVRKGASAKHSILAKLKKGNSVVVVEQLSNSWVKVQYKNGYGYILNKNGAYLKKEDNKKDVKSANKVINLISPLAKDITISDKAKITKARNEYNSLNKNAKKIVNNLSTLKNAENKIKKIEDKINNVDKLISNIPSKLNFQHKAQVLKARKEYNTLTKKEKTYITDKKLSLLISAEQKIVKLEKVESNKLIAEELIKRIDALSDEIQLTDLDEVKDILNQYEGLTLEAKQLVTNYKKIVELNSKLQSMIKVSNVEKIISDLPEDITLNHKAQIKDTRKAYDNLTDVEKTTVAAGKLSILIEAERKIIKLEKIESDKLIAQKLVKRIDALNDDVQYTDITEIDYILKQYKTLDLEAKKVVTNYEKLVRLNNDLQMTLNRIYHVGDLLEKLPQNITLEHEVQVEDVRRSYEALTDIEKTAIAPTQLSLLISAEIKIEGIKRVQSDRLIAQELVERISALSEDVDYTHFSEIRGILSQYEGLIPEAKQLVTNYERVISLNNKLNHVIENIIHANYLINNLPSEITLNHKAQVEEAKQAYDILADGDKAEISEETVNKLQAAVSEIARLQILKEEDESLNLNEE